jgi:hypothetical protein
MTGRPFLEFVSLHRSAIDRQGQGLVNWVLSWFSGKDQPIFLEAEDWYTTGHIHSTCFWSPPPAAADVALEQMAFSIHKRPYHTHLVMIPHLLTSHWRKFLGKVCTLVVTVPLGSHLWCISRFEPLVLSLY